MSLACSTQPKCMARLLFSASQRCILYPQRLSRSPQGCLRLSRNDQRIELGFLSCRIVSTFSTSSRSGFPRKAPPKSPRASSYFGSRNESVENRYVREHNLFNPLSYNPDLGDGNKRESSRKKTSTLSVADTDVADLEREMIWLANNSSPSSRLVNLLHNLTVTRRIRPNTIYYEALILLNASPNYGSAENVKTILEEMEEYKIPTSSTIYTAVLRTMAVHPDPEILAHVIESCSKMWIEIDLEMLHLISAAYLRAGMVEQALDYLEQVETAAQHTGNKIELWLYILFIRELAISKDWDAAMRMCCRLNDDSSLGIPLAMRQVDVPYEFWNWLLEQAAAAGDVWVTAWIWRLWVVRQWIQPRSEVCMQILGSAANAGLVEFAEGVSKYLGYLRSHQEQNLGSETNEQHREGQKTIDKFLAQARLKSGAVKRIPKGRRGQYDVSPLLMLGNDQDAMDEFGGDRRFDPWALLDEETDPGRSWPRILRQRAESEELRRLKTERAAAGRAKQEEHSS